MKKINISSLVIFVLLVVVIGWFALKNNTQKTLMYEKGETTAYKIAYANSENGMDPTFLYNAVKAHLTNTPDAAFELFHDNTFDIASDKNYFYVLTSEPMPKEKNFTEDAFSIKIESDASDLIPYLENPKYCTTDQDCSRTNNFCDVGAYNQYAVWTTFGCGQIGSIEGISEEDLAVKTKSCPVSEITGDPDFLADVTSSKCINNTCTVTDVKITCVK